MTLSVAHASIRLGRRQVLDGVSLDVRPGQVLAILGPNGAGKSTLMNVLSGDLEPDVGMARLDGQALAAIDPVELAQRRAVLPQSSNLSFPFTVFEVVRLGVQSVAKRSAVIARVGEALARVDLTGFGGRFYQQLSGGEQQRVNLARVLAQVWEPTLDGQPRYLLLDEPTSSLDLKHQLLALDLARDFARRGGAVVAILHDVNLAALYADRVVVIDGGRIVADGAPRDVVSPDLMQSVFGVAVQRFTDAGGGAVFIAPAGRAPAHPDGASA